MEGNTNKFQRAVERKMSIKLDSSRRMNKTTEKLAGPNRMKTLSKNKAVKPSLFKNSDKKQSN